MRLSARRRLSGAPSDEGTVGASERGERSATCAGHSSLGDVYERQPVASLRREEILESIAEEFSRRNSPQ